jgi:hypothetical protein
MILPLSVMPSSGEDVLKFIDLSAYKSKYRISDFEGDGLGLQGKPPQLLTVHGVVDFEASYVPTMADFTRLEPRCFRLPDEIWQKMPNYSDYDFAVFQFKLILMRGVT